MANPPELAVIIVSYNTRDLLQRAIASLQTSLHAHGPSHARIIVVDNASHDGSAEMVRRTFPDVELLEPGENLGFARANNLALRHLGFPHGDALPEAVWLLNPDTETVGNAPAQLLAHLRAHPDVAAVGPRLQYGDGRFQHGAFAFPGLLQIAFDLFPLPARLYETHLNGRYPRAWYEQGKPFDVDMVLGAALMVRREAIQQVGLLDEGYFMYVEELDWCRRMKQAGWRLQLVPTALVIHHEGQSTRQFREEMFRALWRSRLRYYTKFAPRPYVWLVRALVAVGLAWQKQRARGG